MVAFSSVHPCDCQHEVKGVCHSHPLPIILFTASLPMTNCASDGCRQASRLRDQECCLAKPQWQEAARCEHAYLFHTSLCVTTPASRFHVCCE